HKAFCRKIRDGFGAGSQAESLLPFRDVVAIVASSRGGSSMLFDLLRSSGAFLCLNGEHSTLYKLHGLGLPPEPGAHDGTISANADTAGFLLALAGDVTTHPATGVSAGLPDTKAFASRVLRMLAQQWRGCPLEPQEAWEVIHDTIGQLGLSGLAD